MTAIGFILLVLIVICAPFYIIYNIYIRRGTGIKWWEAYFICPKCNVKIGENAYYKAETLDQWYTHETKSGQPDLRYKDNPLVKEISYHYKCNACSHDFNLIDTDYDAEEDE